MSWLKLEVDDTTKRKVLENYGKTKDSFEDEAKAIEEWLKTQKHLPEVMGLEMIKFFILINKCDIEKAKNKIDNYYTVHSKMLDIFPSAPDYYQRDVTDAVYYLPLPKLTNDQCRVWVSKVRKPELMNDLNPIYFISQLCKIYEVRFCNDFMWKDIHIYDMEGYTWRYVLKWTPIMLKKAVEIYLKIFSFRVKAVYLINVPRLGLVVLGILKVILKPKIFSRIHLIRSYDEVLKDVPKRILPKDLGGEEASLEELNSIIKQTFEEYRGRFDKLSRMKVNEELRENGPKSTGWFEF